MNPLFTEAVIRGLPKQKIPFEADLIKDILKKAVWKENLHFFQNNINEIFT